MSTIDTGHLIYLVLLGLMVLAMFVIGNRQSLNKTLQQAAIWGLIFVGAIAAVGLWGDIQRVTGTARAVAQQNGQITVPRSPDGHYYLSLDINGVPLRFVVDTGATDLVLRQSDAARAGLSPDQLAYTAQANTANGVVALAPVRLDTVALGPHCDENVRAVVNQAPMQMSLLGMGYLQRWGSITIANNTLTLTR